MLKTMPKRTKQQWIEIFSHAKHGHTLWDGNAPDPHNPIHAITSSHRFVDSAYQMCCFKKGDKILDIGCGNGRLAIAFSNYNIWYEGVDPMLDQIEFSQWAFKIYPNIKFNFINVYNEHFNPNGLIEPKNIRLDYDDNSFDFVIAYSVFTHLQNYPAAEGYMNEVKRVLKPGGSFFSSWYRSPPNEKTDYIGRTTYLESEIMNLLNGFSFQHTYGGHSGEFYDQWGIYAKLL